jgi:hypothetical protein
MKLFAVSLYFETPWMIDVKTGAGIVPLPEHMTTNILADDNQFGALMKAKLIHKDKGQHQWHSVAEIEPVAPVQGGGVDGHCRYAGPGRGDCEHEIGLPGQSIPGQHDGPDDTVDAYGKPNGWCWHCWLMHQKYELEAKVNHLTTTQSAQWEPFSGLEKLTIRQAVECDQDNLWMRWPVDQQSAPSVVSVPSPHEIANKIIDDWNAEEIEVTDVEFLNLQNRIAEAILTERARGK